MELKEILSIIFISSGTFFMFVGSLGLIRLPDFYSRAHATGKVDTLAIILVILGLVIYEGFSVNSAKLIIIITFVALTNPTATSALARAAYKFRLRPWFKKDKSNKRQKKNELGN